MNRRVFEELLELNEWLRRNSRTTTAHWASSERPKADDIRKAYRSLARKYHPDVNPGDKAAEDRFKEVQTAYDVLKDDKKRQMFDQYGFYSDQAFAAGGAPAGLAPPLARGDFSQVISTLTDSIFPSSHLGPAAHPVGRRPAARRIF